MAQGGKSISELMADLMRAHNAPPVEWPEGVPPLDAKQQTAEYDKEHRIDVDENFTQMHINDLPAIPADAPKGTGHKRVPAEVPIPVPQQTENIVLANALFTLHPPGKYLIETSTDANNHVWLGYTYTEVQYESGTVHADKRRRKNGGLITAWVNLFNVLGKGAFGKVYRAQGTFLKQDVGVPMTGEKDDTYQKDIVAKEIVIHDPNQMEPPREYGYYNPHNGKLDVYSAESDGPLDFMATAMLRHKHIVMLYDYTLLNLNSDGIPINEPNVKAAQSVWIGFMELLEGPELTDLIHRWVMHEFFVRAVPTGTTEAQLGALVTAYTDTRKYGGCPEVVARGFMQQLFEGLFCVHQFGVAHMDIKPPNVMSDKHGTWKLVDFGLCLPFTGRKGSEVTTLWGAGSPGFMAPEVNAGRPDIRDLLKKRVPYKGSKADIYSMAAMLFFAIYGETPIPMLSKETYKRDPRTGRRVAVNEHDYLTHFKMQWEGHDTFRPPWLSKTVEARRAANPVSQQLVDFLLVNLHPNPEARLSAKECLQASGGVDWLSPRRGVDSLHDYLMGHGMIVEA